MNFESTIQKSDGNAVILKLTMVLKFMFFSIYWT